MIELVDMPLTPVALAFAVGLVFATGVLRYGRRRGGASTLPPVPTTPTPARPCSGRCEAGDAALSAASQAARQLCEGLTELLEHRDEHADIWVAFDQLLREVLVAQLGVGRVRCFHVQPGSDRLQTLAQSSGQGEGEGPGLRGSLLGHVATSAKEYRAGDPASGPLLDDLAQRDEGHWDWAWPVRNVQQPLGVVAVAQVRDERVLDREARLLVGRTISLCWCLLDCMERLGVVQRTDQASGVLTRSDFFSLAECALADSYDSNEPVVVCTLALEGVRALDDGGRWRDRDRLIEHVGRVIGQRVRSDDLVGRFADDRFVVLLRRLDSGLGRLIAEKLLEAANACECELGDLRPKVTTRVGLAGSGLRRATLEDLLVESLAAVDRARRDGVAIRTDLEATSDAERSP